MKGISSLATFLASAGSEGDRTVDVVQKHASGLRSLVFQLWLSGEELASGAAHFAVLRAIASEELPTDAVFAVRIEGVEREFELRLRERVA